MEDETNIIPGIVIIDDKDDNLTAMEMLLADNIKAKIVLAKSGHEGLSKTLDNNVALILLDINMPEMNGYQVAESLKENPKTCDIPIIFITAISGGEGEKLQGYDCGAIDYIEKPIHPKILLSKVQFFLTLWTLRYNLESELIKRQQAEEQITHLALYDPLTQLPNRRQLLIEIDQLIARCSRKHCKFVVIFADLSQFKSINDKFGHEAGDFLLKQIAGNFKNVIRKSDVVGRLDGDEFVILLDDFIDSITLANRLKKILEAGTATFHFNGSALQVGISIGLAVYPTHAEQNEALLYKADAAMYLAKKAGGNTFRFYSDELNQSLQRRLTLEQHLEFAEKNQEFETYYQPLVDIDTGKPVGAESLLRWHSRELGSIPPDQFIPIAENRGFIHSIGLYVLKQTVDMMAIYPSLRFAVNASPIQFKTPVFYQALANYIDQGLLKPELLDIEITEGMLLERSQQVDEQMLAIKNLGISLSIDDFGTGYSALAYLKRCPVRKLKVDKAFLLDIPDNSESNALVSAIITMGHALGMTIVAEGVETQEQWTFLQAHQCDMAQGYFFSKPLAQQDFDHYMNQYNNGDSSLVSTKG